VRVLGPDSTIGNDCMFILCGALSMYAGDTVEREGGGSGPISVLIRRTGRLHVPSLRGKIVQDR
jgi:hypothetical protein